MRKHIWIRSYQALRKTLNTVGEGDLVTGDYKFAKVYLVASNLNYIFNGMTNNVIATVKTVDNKRIIRYRPASIYSSVLAGFKYKDIETINIPSNNLRSRSNRIRTLASELVSRNIRQEREGRRTQATEATAQYWSELAEMPDLSTISQAEYPTEPVEMQPGAVWSTSTLDMRRFYEQDRRVREAQEQRMRAWREREEAANSSPAMREVFDRYQELLRSNDD